MSRAGLLVFLVSVGLALAAALLVLWSYDDSTRPGAGAWLIVVWCAVRYFAAFALVVAIGSLHTRYEGASDEIAALFLAPELALEDLS